MRNVWFILLGIIVVVLVVFGYQYSLNRYKSSLERALKNSVVISGNAYSPPEMTISPGTEINFVNSDPTDHTVTADGKSFDSGNIPTNNVYKRVFSEPGTYSYHCSIHPEMKGKIIVK